MSGFETVIQKSKETEAKNSRTAVKIILFSLQIICLVWLIIFFIPDFLDIEISKKICSVPIINWLRSVYWGGLPSLISVIVGFANVIYAVVCLHSIFKSEHTNFKKLIGYLVYLIASLCTLVIHALTLDFLVSCMLSA